MNEKKDRTIPIVTIIVIVGLLLSLIGACLSGGVAGYLVARRQIKAAAERFEQQRPEVRIYPPRPEEERPWHFEIPEFPEKFPPLPLRPGVELSGAWIREVIPNSPADRAGLQEGDLIIAVDGQQVDEDHPLQELIGQHEPGDRVRITYLRGMEEHAVKVKLGKHPDDPERAYLGVHFVPFSIHRRFEWPHD